MKHTLLVASILLFAIAACRNTENRETPAAQAIRVRTQAVSFREYKVPVRASGLLSTATEMKLSFKTGGILRKLNVKEGVSVQGGQVLAELDLAEVKAQVNQAHTGLEKARRDLLRAENLYRDSVATLEQFQNAKSAFEVARSTVEIAEFNLEHSRIIAPSDGKIQKILVETNELTGPGYPVILFASTENDWVVRAALTDKDIVKLSLGDSARVFMDAYPGKSFPARIVELGAVADPVTGTYETELLIQHSEPGFRTGFISRAELYPARMYRSLVLPLHALIDATDNRAFVFIYQEGKARKRKVRTGAVLGEEVVVLEGLQAGEEVITDGAKYLLDGAEVELVHTTDPEK
jgi:RND family efflux transporter MFP subunit